MHKERNRQFARESRERKRLYVEGLEREVIMLRAEVERKTERLARYDAIEQQRDIVGDEDHAVMLSALEEMSRTKAGPTQFSSVLIRKMKEMAEGRRKALEQLSQMMLEIAVPFSMRLFLWEAENDIDVFNPACAEKILGYKPDAEQLRLLMNCARSMQDNRIVYDRMKARAVVTSQNIRRNVKQIVECQKGIQLETLRLLRYMKKHLLAGYTPDDAKLDARFAPKLLNRAELSNAAIFQLPDEGLWLDTSVATCWDDSGEDDEPDQKGKKNLLYFLVQIISDIGSSTTTARGGRLRR